MRSAGLKSKRENGHPRNWQGLGWGDKGGAETQKKGLESTLVKTKALTVRDDRKQSKTLSNTSPGKEGKRAVKKGERSAWEGESRKKEE